MDKEKEEKKEKKKKKKKKGKKKPQWCRLDSNHYETFVRIVNRYASALRYGGRRFAIGISIYLIYTSGESINGKEWSSQNFPSGFENFCLI